MAISSIVAAGIGAAGSIGGALLGGGKKQRGMTRAEKRLAAAAELDRAKGVLRGELAANLAQKQLSAAESARIGLFNRLGDIGTYEEGYEDYARRTRGPTGLAGAIGGGTPTGTTGGLFTRVEEKDKVKGTFQYVSDISEGGAVTGKNVGRDFSVTVEGDVLNVPAYLEQVQDSRTFRMMSRLTAEADQLIRREGPLWDELNKSVVGSIYEQTGALQRETMRTISDNLAKGGTARRAGLAAIEAMRAQENINRQRTEALWQSSMAVEQWTRDNASKVMQMNQDYVNNLGGIRDSYNQMMTNITMFHGTGVMPAQINAANANVDSFVQLSKLESQRNDDKNGLGQIVSGISSMVLSAGLKGIFGEQNTSTNTGFRVLGRTQYPAQ